MKNIDKIVENFLDTGKVEGEEDDISNIYDDEIFYRGVDRIETIINEYPNDEWLLKLPRDKRGIFPRSSWGKPLYIETLKEHFKDNTKMMLYFRYLIDGSGGSWLGFLSRQKELKSIIENPEFKMDSSKANILKKYYYSNSNIYIFNDDLKFTELERQKIENWLPVDTITQKISKTLKVENKIEYGEYLFNYIKEKKDELDKLPNGVTELIRNAIPLDKPLPGGVNRGRTSYKKYYIINGFDQYLKDKFNNDMIIRLYLKVINPEEGVLYSNKNIEWNTLLPTQNFIKKIINGGGKLEEKLDRYTHKKIKLIYELLIEKEIPFIFSEISDGSLSSGDKMILEEFFEKTYEDSFTLLGFKQPKTKGGAESLIHNLHWENKAEGKIKYNISNEIINGSDTQEIAGFIINNIINYMSEEGRDVIKYDIISDRIIGDSGGNPVIPDESKIEVKDISYGDSYFSEFLASPVKSGGEISSNEEYRKKYNDIITIIYNWLSDDDEGVGVKNNIKWLMTNDLEGMIISDNVYVPNKDGNIEFYLSNLGQNTKKDIRIAIRYNINVSNYKNFYRIGDGIWGLSEGKKSKKGILYPLENDSLIKSKEKQIHVENTDIDEYINNLLDF
tara:strand:+ start:2118 stop:3968 length:1851 start_codon:yes stop_codon:yes gene_type:complete